MFVDFYLELSKNRGYELIRRGTLYVMLIGVYSYLLSCQQCYHVYLRQAGICVCVCVCVQSFTEDSIEKVDSSINASGVCLREFTLQNFSSIPILIQLLNIIILMSKYPALGTVPVCHGTVGTSPLYSGACRFKSQKLVVMTEVFHRFSQHFQVNSVTIPQIRQRSLLHTAFQIHYLLILSSFDAMHSLSW